MPNPASRFSFQGAGFGLVAAMALVLGNACMGEIDVADDEDLYEAYAGEEGFDLREEEGFDLREEDETIATFSSNLPYCTHTAQYYTIPFKGPYVVGTSSQYPWREDFNRYANGEVIECYTNMGRRKFIDVYRGCLNAWHNASGTVKRGRIASDTFRSLQIKTINGNYVRWTDTRTELRIYPRSIRSGGPAGKASFAIGVRARNPNDLYYVSWKAESGRVVVYVKRNGCYYTLASANEPMTFGQWHAFRVDVIGQLITVRINGNEKIGVTVPKALKAAKGLNPRISSGYASFRSDYMNLYIDDYRTR